MKKYAIIVAGGKGKRMGTELPKQFLKLDHKAILLHSLEAFKKALPEINLILVLPEDQIAYWKELSVNTDFKDISLAKGGKERADSVKAGLELLDEDSIVGIHDAVRPLVSSRIIQEAYRKAEQKQCGIIPVVKLKDSIRMLNDSGSVATDRENFRIVQTPQCFPTKPLLKAYHATDKRSFTDDASLFEAAGGKIKLIEGSEENLKITQPIDLKIAESILQGRN